MSRCLSEVSAVLERILDAVSARDSKKDNMGRISDDAAVMAVNEGLPDELSAG
jgi:ornithine carbamoyltransferase